MEGAQILKSPLDVVIVGDAQVPVLESALGQDVIAESGKPGYFLDVAPVEVELGVQRYAQCAGHLQRTFPGRRFPVIGQFAMLLQLQLMPFYRISARDKEMIVLAEFAEGDEDLSAVGDLRYHRPDPFRLISGIALYKIPVLQQYCGTLELVTGRDDTCLSGSLDLQLGPQSGEFVQYVHGGRGVGQ